MSGTKLPNGQERVQVVSTNKVLGHSHNGGGERLFAVVVGRVLGHIAGQLRHLDLSTQLALEA